MTGRQSEITTAMFNLLGEWFPSLSGDRRVDFLFVIEKIAGRKDFGKFLALLNKLAAIESLARKPFIEWGEPYWVRAGAKSWRSEVDSLCLHLEWHSYWGWDWCVMKAGAAGPNSVIKKGQAESEKDAKAQCEEAAKEILKARSKRYV